MTETIAIALQTAWANFLLGIDTVLPRVLAMLSIVLVGWFVAAALAFVVRQILRWTKINLFAQKSGAAELLKKTELPPLDALVGGVTFWVVWIAFLLSGASALGLAGMDVMTMAFMGFVPRLVAALAILIVGILAANFAWRATLLATVNAKMRSARFASNAVRFFIIVLTVAMALEQIAVAKAIVVTAFAIAFGAVMLGLAVSFGIGGGGIAKRFLERQFPEQEPERPDSISHL